MNLNPNQHQQNISLENCQREELPEQEQPVGGRREEQSVGGRREEQSVGGRREEQSVGGRREQSVEHTESQHGQNLIENFKIGIHQIPQVYSSLSPLGKSVFIARFFFLVFQIGWAIAIISVYFNTPSANGYVAAFSIWLFLAVISLQLPLYFCINQPHLNDPVLLQREGRKRFIYSWMDTLFLVPFIVNGILMFNGPSQSTEFPLLYYTALIWLILSFGYTFFPALLACIAVLCLPCIFLVLRNAQAREEARVRALGASEDLIQRIPILRFKKSMSTSRIIDAEAPPITPFELAASSLPCSLPLAQNQNQPSTNSTSSSIPPATLTALRSTVIASSPTTPLPLTIAPTPPVPLTISPTPPSPLSVVVTQASSPQKRHFRLFPILTLSRKDTPSSSIPQKIIPEKTISIPSQDALCSICLCEYEDDEELRQLSCLHHYHVGCIDEWLKRNAMCPQCRTRDLLTSNTNSSV